MTAPETLTYTFTPTSVGLLLLAVSQRGICCIQLGDSRGPLLAELAERFPRAELTEDATHLAATSAKLAAMVDSDKPCEDLSLDVRGTPFQLAVWQALREIPRGATSTYTSVAQRIGAPRAVRAVAGACAANRLAIIIPCHRVLTKTGSISGYRWGVDRKRALLEREKAVGRQ